MMFWQNKVLLPLASGASNSQAKAKMEELEGRVEVFETEQPAGKRQRGGGGAGGVVPKAPPSTRTKSARI